ncbi:hypothetical protein RAA17_15610 [Komagataeibacter rhaeticus]|nr:hypothetical protein [Komagataeibacter rhaeticus]
MGHIRPVGHDRALARLVHAQPRGDGTGPASQRGIRVDHDVAARHHCGFWDRHPTIPDSLFP